MQVTRTKTTGLGFLFALSTGLWSSTALANPSARIEYTRTTVDVQTDEANFRGHFIVFDVEGRRARYRGDTRGDLAYGEMEFTWDAPPQMLSEDAVAILNFGGRIIVAPRGGAGTGIDLFTGPTGLFDTTPPPRVGQYVGKTGNGDLVQGYQKVQLRAPHISSSDASTDVTISFGLGLAIVTYHYRVVKGGAPLPPPAVTPPPPTSPPAAAYAGCSEVFTIGVQIGFAEVAALNALDKAFVIQELNDAHAGLVRSGFPVDGVDRVVTRLRAGAGSRDVYREIVDLRVQLATLAAQWCTCGSRGP